MTFIQSEFVQAVLVPAVAPTKAVCTGLLVSKELQAGARAEDQASAARGRHGCVLHMFHPDRRCSALSPHRDSSEEARWCLPRHDVYNTESIRVLLSQIQDLFHE